ncbi:hypothetical protein YC2023_075995 [Brassica napus]
MSLCKPNFKIRSQRCSLFMSLSRVFIDNDVPPTIELAQNQDVAAMVNASEVKHEPARTPIKNDAGSAHDKLNFIIHTNGKINIFSDGVMQNVDSCKFNIVTLFFSKKKVKPKSIKK